MNFFNNIGNALRPKTNGVSNAFNSISNSNELTPVYNNNNTIPTAFYNNINSVWPGVSNIF